MFKSINLKKSFDCPLDKYGACKRAHCPFEHKSTRNLLILPSEFIKIKDANAVSFSKCTDLDIKSHSETRKINLSSPQMEAYTPRCDFYSEAPSYAKPAQSSDIYYSRRSEKELIYPQSLDAFNQKYEPTLKNLVVKSGIKVKRSVSSVPDPNTTCKLPKYDDIKSEKLNKLMTDMLSSDSEDESEEFPILKRPTAPLKWSGKIPMQIRIRYLDQFIEFYLKICKKEHEAYKKGLDCEQACHDQSASRSVYLALTAKRLKEFKEQIN